MPVACDVLLDAGISFEPPPQLALLIEFAAKDEPTAPAGDWQMTIRLTDDCRIAALHEQFFGDPGPTDVISFPSGEPFVDGGGYLGDVVISVETASIQAGAVGHSTEREVAFLALHGLLHLCGHDDQTATERAQMLTRQEQLLNAFEDEAGRSW